MVAKGDQKTPQHDQQVKSIDESLQSAVQHHTSGRFPEAETIYKQVLKADPNQPVALHLLGVLAHQFGHSDAAVELISKALTINPEYVEAHNNIGLALQALGRLDEAIESFCKAVVLKPDYSEAFGNLGVSLQSQGKFDQAIDNYRKAIDINPDYFKAHNNLGLALKKTGKIEVALESYLKALAINPNYPEAHNNLGNLLSDKGQLKKAEDHFEKALSQKPDYAEAHNNLGNVFKARGELDKAGMCYRKALNINPEYADAHNNLGNALMGAGMVAEAVASYQRALGIDPNHTEYHNNLGNAFKESGHLAESISAYREALRIEPDFEGAAANLLYQLRQACAWKDVEALDAKVRKFTELAIRDGKDVAFSPFASVTSHDDPSENFKVAQARSREISKRMSCLTTGFPMSARRQSRSKITIGYLSNDFQHHATAHLMLSLFELHDREHFNVFCFSHGKNDASSYRKKIELDSDKFFDIQATGHLDAARMIYEAGVDILVDLKGHTANSRLEICALRPAPVQVSYLGFPGTSGADFLDYFITDRIVTPDEHIPFYSEKLVYMPHCYQINDFRQQISSAPLTRADFGLPEEGFIFCSFNGSLKIEPVIFGVWINLLKKTPGSILWLYRSNKAVEANLRKEAESRGVAGERLVFADSLPKDQHLSRYRLADLALDTRICCGHTTTSDALWAGVPVITIIGAHFASRVSASVLSAVGMPELITKNPGDYEALALRLSQNPDELAELRAKLTNNRLSEPLFDTPRFVRSLENAYRQMWETFLSGREACVINEMKD